MEDPLARCLLHEFHEPFGDRINHYYDNNSRLVIAQHFFCSNFERDILLHSDDGSEWWSSHSTGKSAAAAAVRYPFAGAVASAVVLVRSVPSAAVEPGRKN